MRLEPWISARLGPALSRLPQGLGDFLTFGLKQAWACLFAVSFFAMLGLSRYLPPCGLARYDFLFLGALVLQGILIATRWEEPRDALVILVFHLVGFGLELFKTSPEVGSWSYPEAGFFKIATVPLYAGFMYASVGSYLLKIWKLIRLEFTPFPNRVLSVVLCVLVYTNFFTNHYFADVRWVLAVALVVVYARTWVSFTPRHRSYRMPLLAGFFLISLFIWLGENIATLFGAWVYPDQTARWQWVNPQKISSWALLVTISFVIVALLSQTGRRPSPETKRMNEQDPTGPGSCDRKKE